MTRSLFLAVGTAFAAAACGASDMSTPTGVFVDPDATLLWRTAPSGNVVIPIEYPPMASSVDIAVKGVRYSDTFPGVTAASQALVLPEPTTYAAENVYEVTLGFDDGTTNRCAFAVVHSQSAGGSCQAWLTSAAAWPRVSQKQVMVVPAGNALSVDGEAASALADGAWGWFACPRLAAGEHEFVLSGEGGDVARSLFFVLPGMMFLIK